MDVVEGEGKKNFGGLDGRWGEGDGLASGGEGFCGFEEEKKRREKKVRISLGLGLCAVVVYTMEKVR